MKTIKVSLLSLFLWSSLLGNTDKGEPRFHLSDALPKLYPDFCLAEKRILADLSYPDSMQTSYLQKNPMGSKLYPEFSKFKPPVDIHNWDLNYTQKQREIQEKAQKDKEYVRLLRAIDTTHKTEYFQRVLRSPIPEACKGDPQHNSLGKGIIFLFGN